MKLLGEAMHRSPTFEEAQTLRHVVELAQAWKRGDLPLESVRAQCTGFERWQAMRFAELGSSDKRALMALLDALVAEDKAVFSTPQGLIHMYEVYEGGAKAVTTHDGRRAFVWPMFEMDGQKAWPRYEMPRDMERFQKEDDMIGAYRDYRKAKRPKGYER